MNADPCVCPDPSREATACLALEARLDDLRRVLVEHARRHVALRREVMALLERVGKVQRRALDEAARR